jgi:hypothetical protein
MICATFHCAGKCPFMMVVLNNCVRYFIPTIGSSVRILPVTRYQPGAFFVFRLLATS